MPRLMVVDDFEDIPDLVKVYLTAKPEFKLDTANSGEEALKLLLNKCIDHQCYDLIIIDLAMPIMDGYSLAKRIRDLEKQLGWKNAAIIFFTAHAEIARLSSSILNDLKIATEHVYNKDNIWKMFEDIIHCFDQKAEKVMANKVVTSRGRA